MDYTVSHCADEEVEAEFFKLCSEDQWEPLTTPGRAMEEAAGEAPPSPTSNQKQNKTHLHLALLGFQLNYQKGF